MHNIKVFIQYNTKLEEIYVSDEITLGRLVLKIARVFTTTPQHILNIIHGTTLLGYYPYLLDS